MRDWLYCKWWRVREWCERVVYCHHNARVLADMEHRFSCVLTHCTHRMSKPYYTVEAMRAEIDDYITGMCDEAYKEGQADLREEFASDAELATNS